MPDPRTTKVVANVPKSVSAQDALTIALDAVFRLSDRVKALEQRLEEKSFGGLADAFRGSYVRTQDYPKGSLVLHGSAVWLALSEAKAEDVPGACDRWKLILKSPR